MTLIRMYLMREVEISRKNDIIAGLENEIKVLKKKIKV